jgi:hypothetical protein
VGGIFQLDLRPQLEHVGAARYPPNSLRAL